MIDLLQTSLLWRLLQAISAWFGRLPSGSVLCGAWKTSYTRSVFRAAGESDAPALHESFFERILQGAKSRLAGWEGVRTCVLQSVPGRVVSWLVRVTAASKSLGWLASGGITGILLTVLALYSGIDWALRDVLPLPLISSVWDELLLIAALVFALWQRTGVKKAEPSRTTTLDMFVAAFILICLALMLLISPRMDIAVSGYRAVCQYLLWFFLVSRLLRGDGDYRRMYYAMLALAGVIALHGVYQYIIAVPIPAHWVAQAEQSVRTRVFSIFGSPNIMACYMVMFAPMAAGLAYSRKGWQYKVLGWGLAVLMCVSCLFTMSRGGWVAMAVAILVFALLVDGRLLLLMAVAGVASLALPFVASRIGFLFTEDFTKANSNGGRDSRWRLGMEYLQNFGSPLFGMGFGQFGGAVAMQNQIHRSYLSYFYMDNYYMKTLTETGYVGLFSYLAMLMGLIVNGLRSLYRSFRTKADGFYAMSAGIFAGLCGTMVHCYFENIFEEPYMLATFWILAAMLLYGGLYRPKLKQI